MQVSSLAHMTYASWRVVICAKSGFANRNLLSPQAFLFIFLAQRAIGRLQMSKKAREGVGNEGRAQAEEAI